MAPTLQGVCLPPKGRYSEPDLLTKSENTVKSKNKITIYESVELTQKWRFGSPTGSGSSLQPTGRLNQKYVKLFKFRNYKRKPYGGLASKTKFGTRSRLLTGNRSTGRRQTAKFGEVFLTKQVAPPVYVAMVLCNFCPKKLSLYPSHTGKFVMMAFPAKMGHVTILMGDNTVFSILSQTLDVRSFLIGPNN